MVLQPLTASEQARFKASIAVSADSLVPRRGGGGERAPGTHCSRMRLIIAKATCQN